MEAELNAEHHGTDRTCRCHHHDQNGGERFNIGQRKTHHPGWPEISACRSARVKASSR